MRLKNPYLVGPNTRIDLRDTKGRYSNVKKAKYFYVYMNDKLILMDEFPLVSMSQSAKWAYIEEYLKAIYEEQVEELPLKEPEEELEEILDDIEEIGGEDPKLAEALFKDFLKIIEKEDPALFEALVPMPAKGELEIEEDELYAKRLEADGRYEKWYFTLKPPRKIKSHNHKELSEFIENRLVPIVKELFEERRKGEGFILFRITYDRRISERKYKYQGIGTARAQVNTWEEFRSLILDPLYDKLTKRYNRYLSSNIDKVLKITGFTLENLYKFV